MKKTVYQTNLYNNDHTRFGGRIFISDFDRKSSLADITDRIISDQCFDRECEQNAKNRAFHQIHNNSEVKQDI